MKCHLIFFIISVSLSFQNVAYAVTVRDAVFSTRQAGKVVFKHDDHIYMKETINNCRACHDVLFDLKKKKKYSMADMEKGRSCGACHTGTKAFALKECVRCHRTKEITYNVRATGPTEFSHRSHLVSSPNCTVCHPAVFAAGANKRFTMAAMEKGKSCGACHNGTKAFGLSNCVKCHPVKEITFAVKETGPTQFSHKTHLAVTTCAACHPKLYIPNQKNRRVGMAAMEKGKSCGACHNSKQAFSVKECSRCHPTQELNYKDTGAGAVVFSHRSHTGLYSCSDCHTKLFKTTGNRVKVSMQVMEAGKSCGGCHDGKTAFDVKEKCDSCHKM
ncbi:MAG: cytochrome c3 family protein [Desulfuromonadaceae bacterium]|nr:cytochrome c3 family protein [Desulfuromonadaceae bacterium]